MLLDGGYCTIISTWKKNSSELVKAVRNLSDCENEYIIVLDRAFDNIQTVREHQLLQRWIFQKKNVHALRIICFEYVLLEFKSLMDWIYAPEDEFFRKRAAAITAREKLLAVMQNGEIDYKQIEEIRKYQSRLDTMNIEQLSAKLLFDLTRNTGFEVTKGQIGECWIQPCCGWNGRQNDDICGLDSNRISLFEKMRAILINTSLENEFHRAGWEAAI